MSDRELLERAAKAAGYGEVWSLDDHPDVTYIGPRYLPGKPAQYRVWNPLTDDGDAFRLAVKLGLHITSSDTDAWVSQLAVTAIESFGSDPLAATRRAIVRAAAEIGRSMK